MSEEALAAASAGLEAKTGRDLAAWIALAKNTGIARHKPLVEYLKTQHGIGHGHANTIALRRFASDADSIGDDALIEAMFSGVRGQWRELYSRLVEAMREFGDDVEIAPKKGYVSLRRSKQFGLLQPSTRDRFDIGLALKGEAAEGRFELAGSWNAMVSHRIRIARPEEADDEVIAFLLKAYERA